MAIVYTIKENIEHLNRILEVYNDLIDRISGAVDTEKDFFKQGTSSPSFVETTLNGIISGAEAILETHIVALLDVFSFNSHLWVPVVDMSIGVRTNYYLTGIAVDVVDGGGSKLTRNHARIGVNSIFEIFDVSDIVEIVGAEDSNHNGFHTVSSVTGNGAVMNFDANMLGSDNANDETMIVKLYKR